MSVEEIKRGIASLSTTELGEVTAFLFHVRHAADPAYQDLVGGRLSDGDSAQWVTPEEFERRLDLK